VCEIRRTEAVQRRQSEICKGLLLQWYLLLARLLLLVVRQAAIPVRLRTGAMTMKSISTAALFAALLVAAGTAKAEFSANIGWASDYYYRGIFQAQSSASGGIDYESNGFFAGTWAADVGDGLEVDGYIGYGGDIGDISYGVGYTGYFYTGDFDDSYQEVNLSGGLALLGIEVAIGRYNNFDGPTQDYTYYALTFEKNGFYGKVGGFAQDFKGEYLEAGYGTTVADLVDLGLTLIVSNKDLNGSTSTDETLVFTIGKSFDF
jgi:uncharacterized protein (TIGR02001 family)